MEFSRRTIEQIDAVFQTALDQGRTSLHEFEVYQILDLIGLEVPRFTLVRDPAAVDEQMLARFGRDIVVKIVSPSVPHKQKLGGVKIIRNHDPLFVQFVMMRMREEVLAHFPPDRPPVVEGFLIVEFVPYTQALGNEQLIGIKEDPAFGPVLTLSKGGEDAEFFAKYYDPANLFLPTLDYDQARASVHTLHIKHRFEEIGHPEYLDHSAKALSLLSWLSYHYSFIGSRPPSFIIKALDVNPFVITKDHRFVAIDGFAQFAAAEENRITVPPVDLNNLGCFFHPEGIAVIGVSADLGKQSLGREIAHLLHDLGRQDLFFVNAKGGSIRFGETDYPLYKSLRDVPRPPELVVYAAPAQYTMEFAEDVAATRPKAVILISGIPANIKYTEFVKEIEARIPGETRIIGPNCMGVFHAPDQGRHGLNTFFLDEKRLEVRHSARSNTVLLTQSGALAVTAIDKFQYARIFRAIVSFGNKCDVNITDLLAYFGRDEGIELIALYVEGLDPGEGRQFFQLARETTKPIIAYKAGRTEAGARAAASHTASMSGSYDVFRAACLQSGVVLADNIEDQYNLIRVFSLLAKKIPAGNRVAGVVNAGFESTVGADELGGLRQAQLSPESVERLNAINRYGLVDTSSPFLDITPMADDRMYADFVEAILQDEGVDCVFVAIIPHAVVLKTTPDTCRDADSLGNLLVALGRKYGKPMVISVNAGRHYQDFVAVLEEGGLPVYTDIRAAIRSLEAFVGYHTRRALGGGGQRHGNFTPPNTPEGS